MKFSKAKWLESANAQIEQGILSQREVDDALDIWVNEMDGKTEEEILKNIATALGITDEDMAAIVEAARPSTDEETSADETTPDELYLGDADGDGKVNVKDATAIQKFVAGFEITINMESADADLSLQVNVKDATAIQKFVAGLQVNTPIGIPYAAKDA